MNLNKKILEPTHIQLRDYLLSQTRGMNHGQRLPSIRDLMKRFKISQATVEKALAELEEQGMLQRIHGRGIFFCQQQNSRKSSRLIGLLLPNQEYKFVRYFARGVTDEAERKGYHILLSNFESEKEMHEVKAFDKFSPHDPDATIICNITENLTNPKYNKKLYDFAKTRQKCIMAENPIPNFPQRWVGVDNFSAGYECAKDFMEKGYQRCHVFWDPFKAASFNRASGFKRYFQEIGVAESGRRLKFLDVVSLLNHEIDFSSFLPDKPVAIFNANQDYLLPVLSFIKGLGRPFGSDIYFASIVEEDFREMIREPAVVFVKPSYQMGVECVKLALGGHKSRANEPQSICLPFEKKII